MGKDSEAIEQPREIHKTEDQSVSWTASEFVHHEKSPGWYLSLTIAAGVLAALIYFVLRDVVSAGVVLVAAFIFGIYAAHKPRQLEYQLDQSGLTIADKHYPYHEFKTFSLQPEGAFASIVFMPLKRFAPVTTIYYPPEDEDKILTVLSAHLPFEEPRRDAVDSLMRRIRF